MIEEDKVTLTRTRAELVESLAGQLPTAERVRIQGELSLVNAKIKALNTIQAAQLKATADQRKIAGLTEAQANAARAAARRGLIVPSTSAPIGDDADDDPGQTAAIDGWIDAALLRNDVDFTRDARGRVTLTSDPSRPHVPQKLAVTIELLINGIYATTRGQELPDLPSPPPKAPNPAKVPKKSKRS